MTVTDPPRLTPGPPATVRRPKVAGARPTKASSGRELIGAVKSPDAAAAKPGIAPLARAAFSLGERNPIGSVLSALTASAAMPTAVDVSAGTVAMPSTCSSDSRLPRRVPGAAPAPMPMAAKIAPKAGAKSGLPQPTDAAVGPWTAVSCRVANGLACRAPPAIVTVRPSCAARTRTSTGGAVPA